MSKICFANQKGGVAKSTSCVNLAAGLAKRGHQVLLIDMDPQANATFSTVGFTEPSASIYDVLLGKCSISEAILPAHNMNIDLVPSSIDLAGAEVELVSSIGAQLRLRNTLEIANNLPHDFILIDSPPNLGLLTVNALAASNGVIIPVAGGAYGLRGLAQLLSTIDQIRDHLRTSHLRVLGILVTVADRTNVTRDVEYALRDQYGELVFKTTIPRNVAVEESHTRQQSVLDYEPTSKSAEAYLALVDEVMQRG
jgi:chromosome partitioning protein